MKKSSKSDARFQRYSLKRPFLAIVGQWAGPADAQRGSRQVFFGKKNIRNEFSTIKLARVQIFSQIGQLLKITIRGGQFLTFF